MTRARETGENARLAKAWVNFNGTGTVAIRASFNVSSITDLNTGNYAINFTNAMADANYCVMISSRRASTFTSSGDQMFNGYTTTTFTIGHYENTALTDVELIHISVFR